MQKAWQDSMFYLKNKKKVRVSVVQNEITLLGRFIFLIWSGIISNLLFIKVCVCLQNQAWIKRKVKLNFKWNGLSSTDPPECRGIDYMNTQYLFQTYF